MSELPPAVDYNRESWNHAAENQQRWSQPVSPEAVANARSGKLEIVLTPIKLIPEAWLQGIHEKNVLLLAGSGGQQAPLVAATGASVTVFDLSPSQLALDREVAQREALELKTVEGSMDDLGAFADHEFDLIIHPCSNTFVPDIRPVWREAARVLKPGGEILSGFINPVYFLFDEEDLKKGEMNVQFSVPYSDLKQRSDDQIQKWKAAKEPLCFGHTLADQLAGQTSAGLMIIDMYEDFWGPGDCEVLDRHLPTMMATRSRKLSPETFE